MEIERLDVVGLVRGLSLEEKVAQLVSVDLNRLIENGSFSEKKAEELIANGVGEIGGASGAGIPPRQAAALVNSVQRFLLERTRAKIPALVLDECLAGLKGRAATAFPQSIALASSWNPELVGRMAASIGKRITLIGTRHCLSPVLDLAVDPRWGRTEETYGEDPYLASSMGVAYASSLQAQGVAATGKHFAGHGSSEGGRNTAPVNVSERFLRENHLRTFEAAVKVAKLRFIMAAYHQIDEVPCHVNEWLLTKVLREEWGFDGVVISDGWGVPRLREIDGVASSCKEAAIKALMAGVDLELPGNCYRELISAVKEGLIPESAVDAAVERVLRLKFQLGLFDNPYVDESQVPDSLDTPEDRALALEAARESIVLLKNEGVLPLAKSAKLAVIGPNAADPRDLFGDYHYTAHVMLKEPTVKATSVLDAIKGRASNVFYAKGCDVALPSKDGFGQALEAARQADVVVAVLGDRSGGFWFNPSKYDEVQVTVGEGVDSHDLRLPGAQEDLLIELEKLGKPLVLVLINGRPYSIPNPSAISAVVEAWLPGEEGGEAIAEVLFGEVNPSGHLPISYPKSVGQLPDYYYRRKSSMGSYVFSDSKPLYPFGHGLSYTTFSYSSLSVTPQVNPGGFAEISFYVENTGGREGKEVVQLYVSKPVASVSRPAKELKAFAKLSLKPGEKKKVTFRVPAEILSFYDQYMRQIVEEGEYVVEVGSSSEDVRLTGKFSVTKTLVIGDRKRFFSETAIE
ncbi:glycoside hydrolase family 3 N-terminal domain-containing protein [Tardisphaera miroshnichenkoae]